MHKIVVLYPPQPDPETFKAYYVGTHIPLARKLPGRGMWVAADRTSVATAAKKGLFARSAKAPVKAAADLPDQVEALLRTRILAGLGLARRAGDLTSGFEKVAAAIGAGKTAWLIEATFRISPRSLRRCCTIRCPADGEGEWRDRPVQHDRRRTFAGLH